MSEQKSKGGQPPPRWFLKAFTRLHVIVYRVSGGRIGRKLGGDEICMVKMTGAKTGKQRTIPLMYVPDGDAMVLVASQGGAPRNPGWYHNLVKHPEVTIEHNGVSRALVARLVDAEEKERLWKVCVEHYAAYEDYRQRTTRDIPVFRCEPR